MKRMVTEKEIGEVAVDSVSEAIESGVIDLGNGIKKFSMEIRAQDITKVGGDWQTTEAYAIAWKNAFSSMKAVLCVYFGFGSVSYVSSLVTTNDDPGGNVKLSSIRACHPNYSSTYGDEITTDGIVSAIYQISYLSIAGGNDEYTSIDDVIADDSSVSIEILYI